MRPHLVAWLDGFLPHDVALLVAPSWFTCVGLAGLVTLFWMLRLARRHGIDGGLVASAILWGYLAAVTAGIVVPMAIDAVQQYVASGRVRVRWSGMTSFWGYLAGLGAVAAVCRHGGLSIGRLGDLAAAPLGLALVFARLGCFLGGCDYGKVTASPLAMRFPSGSPAWRDHVRAGLLPPERAESLPVHATMLYEAGLGLVMVAVALWASRRPWARERDGRVFLVGAATYAVGRIGIEALRGDAGRGFTLGLSSGQVFSLLVLAAIGGGLLLSRRRLAGVIAATAAVMGLADLHPAEAQPGQTAPGPGVAPAPVPAPTPAPGPISPYDDPDAATAPAPMPAPVPAPMPPYPMPASAPEATGRRILQVGALLGIATPINRRQGQVPPLTGPTLSVGLALGRGLGVWLDFDSMGNADAAHGTLLLSGSMMTALQGGIEIGGRIGFGSTLVNFDEPAFRDVAGPTLRAEAIAEYGIGDKWALWVRPLSFDVLTSDNLGGPITTWQIRVGVAHRFGPRRSNAASSPPASPPGTIATQ